MIGVGDRLAPWIFRWRRWLTGLVVLGAVVAAPSADFTTLDNDMTAWFSKQDPVYVEYERFRQEFGGTRTLIVALEGDVIFTPDGLDLIRTVTREIERVDTVERVQSLTTANVVTALPETGADDAGGIEVNPLLPEKVDAGAAARVKARALGDRLMRGDLVSEDGRVTAIIVSFDESRIDEVRAGVIQKIHEVIDPRLPAGLKAYYNGSLEITESYNRVTLDNLYSLTPIIFGFMLLSIYVLFRSVTRTLLVFVAILTSVLWTMGLYTLLGFSYNVLSSILPALIVVLAVADDVHIVQHFDHEYRLSGDHERAFTSSVAHLFAPLLGASVTTALGMLSLATSDIAAVREFGMGAAIGVMVDFVLSLVYVPTLMGLVRVQRTAPPQERWLIGPLRAIAQFSIRRSGVVLATVAVVSAVALAGLTRLRVDTNHINFFADTHPLHQSAVLIDNQLAGIYTFQVMLEGPADSLKSPDTMARIERLERLLQTLPSVRKVVSHADYIKRVNRQLHGDRPDAEVIPPSAEAIAQELFLFGLADDGRAELERVVSSDFSRAQITVKMASHSSDLVFQEIASAGAMADQAFAGSDVDPSTTGSGKLFSTLDHYMVMSQLSSFGTAFLTVFGVIFLVFRSARFGVLAIVANTFPVLVILGFMGWLGITLNIATIMVASVTLGVVDDDTIHFINRYRREAAEGATTEDAIETATIHEGRASLTTAIINTLAYGILGFSSYKPTSWFGGLLALTMAVAFLAEVFIVPAVITRVRSVFATERVRAAA
ncbi:MAG: MMPL family transporter [Vicinamibacteria bacterium]|nr:MMPL family transporter [Vicinamibacteria bacterium]